VRSLATVVMVVLAMLTGVTAASAGTPVWKPYPCFTGELRAADSRVDSIPQPGYAIVDIPGIMDCVVSDPDARWALGVWKPGQNWGDVSPNSIRPYEPGDHTKFDALKYIQQDAGVCLMPDPNTKLSCVRLQRVGTTLNIVQAAPDDPFFFGPGQIDSQTSPGGCDHCW
jgi:hypothetical protein